jgi:hypothetical protein
LFWWDRPGVEPGNLVIISDVVPSAFAAIWRNDVTTRSKKRFFAELQPLPFGKGRRRLNPRPSAALSWAADALPCSSFSIRHEIDLATRSAREARSVARVKTADSICPRSHGLGSDVLPPAFAKFEIQRTAIWSGRPGITETLVGCSECSPGQHSA